MNRSYQKSIDQSVWIDKVHNDHRIVDNNKVDSHLYMEKSHNYYHHSYSDTYTNTHTQIDGLSESIRIFIESMVWNDR